MRLTKCLTRFTEKRVTGGGQAHCPVASPLDQHHTQILFQPFNRNRQGRLGHTEAVSRTVEVPLLRNGDELLHFTQIDHEAPRSERLT